MFQHVSVYTVFVCIYVICEQTIMCVITVNADVIFCGFVNKGGGGVSKSYGGLLR